MNGFFSAGAKQIDSDSKQHMAMEHAMGKVTGVGAIMMKTADKDGMISWLTENLGMAFAPWGAQPFKWRDRDNPEVKGYTLVSVSGPDNDYFDPSPLPFMINLRVEGLDDILADLATRGIVPVRVFDPEPNGRFVHIMAPGGLKIELWEPVSDDPYDV
jgi:hypothetical protein